MFGKQKITNPFLPSRSQDNIQLLFSREGIEDPFRFFWIFGQERVKIDHVREETSGRELESPPATDALDDSLVQGQSGFYRTEQALAA
jgi:hypothetical protein